MPRSTRGGTSDFFDGQYGSVRGGRSRDAGLKDLVCDGLLALNRSRSGIRSGPGAERQRILVTGVEVAGREADVHAVIDRLAQTRRHVVVRSVVPMGDFSKFGNIDRAIAAAGGLGGFDWLVIIDDDVAFADGLLDDLIAFGRAADLSLLQPAHAFSSYASYDLTIRRRASLVRKTRFVEIGPVTLIRSDVFDLLLPFPQSRWCYGIDVLWSALASRHGFRMGVIDGSPIQHLRPVGGSYNFEAARAEGRAFLATRGITLTRKDILGPGSVVL